VTVDDVILTNLYTCDILNLLFSALYSQISLSISVDAVKIKHFWLHEATKLEIQVSTEYS
jgi:hypothetical protein